MLWRAAWTLFRFAGETAMAVALVDRAATLNPNAVSAWICKGWVHAMRNQPEAAIEAMDRVLRLNPFDPIGYFATAAGAAYAHLVAHRFERAIKWADCSLNDAPRYMHPLQVKVAANAHLGRLDETRAALARLLAAVPGLTIAKGRTVLALSTSPEVLDVVFTGLRVAGLPEGEAAEPFLERLHRVGVPEA